MTDYWNTVLRPCWKCLAIYVGPAPIHTSLGLRGLPWAEGVALGRGGRLGLRGSPWAEGVALG